MHPQIRFLDHHVRPHQPQQLVLAHHLARLPHQADQQVEGARSQRDGVPAGFEPAPAREQRARPNEIPFFHDRSPQEPGSHLTFRHDLSPG